jgi:hypothetical protein
MVDPRTRATAASDNDIGQERYELYKSSFDWIKKSIDEGYYLEAISILESLVSDRLESYLSFSLDRDFCFKNLGALIDKIKSDETDEILRSLIINDLDKWRKQRNKAAHEMVKIEDGKSVVWEERVKINKEVAETGLLLFHNINNRIRKLRKQTN